MNGRRTRTVAGRCRGRLDTVRLMLNGVNMATWPGFCAALSTGWYWSARRRVLAHPLSGAVGLVKAGPQGIAVEFGAETLRACEDGLELVHELAATVGSGVTVPRLDWANQEPWTATAVADAMQRALVAGFVTASPGSEGLPDYIRGGAGETYYLQRRVYRRVVNPDGTNRVLRDEFVWRCYTADDGDGVVYVRTEVQERIGSRRYTPVFEPHPFTVAALGLAVPDCGELEPAERVESKVAQVARGLSLLAAGVPEHLAGDIVLLVEKLSRVMGAPFEGARDRLAERQRRKDSAMKHCKAIP